MVLLNKRSLAPVQGLVISLGVLVMAVALQQAAAEFASKQVHGGGSLLPQTGLELYYDQVCGCWFLQDHANLQELANCCVVFFFLFLM